MNRSSLLSRILSAVRRSLSAALALLLPTECVGCGARDHPFCPACQWAAGPPGSTSTALVIDPPGSRLLPVWAAVRYGGAVSAALSAFKESGRTDAARALAGLLAPAVLDARAALRASLPPGATLELTVAPSSRAAFRRRGYHPVVLLASRAKGSLVLTPALRVSRATADQAGLGVAARQSNLSGSMEVRRKFPAGLRNRHFLLVDDVVTTGATLVECRRSLESAGATVWGAVTLAYTPKHRGMSSVRVSGEREGQLR